MNKECLKEVILISRKRLELDTSDGLENVYVKDQGIVKADSGIYLMFYVTRMIK